MFFTTRFLKYSKSIYSALLQRRIEKHPIKSVSINATVFFSVRSNVQIARKEKRHKPLFRNAMMMPITKCTLYSDRQKCSATLTIKGCWALYIFNTRFHRSLKVATRLGTGPKGPRGFQPVCGGAHEGALAM